MVFAGTCARRRRTHRAVEQDHVGRPRRGHQGKADLRGFLRHEDVRVTAICDVNKRHIEQARGLIAERYGKPDVKVCHDFRELN